MFLHRIHSFVQAKSLYSYTHGVCGKVQIASLSGLYRYCTTFQEERNGKTGMATARSPLLYNASPPFSCIVVGLHSSETLAVVMLHCVVGRCRITARRQP